MRDLRWDNIRFVLIYLVVFGHMLELCQGQEAHMVYQLIYSFHMPAFVFVTGYFAKFKLRTLATLAGCYVIFQTLYLLFAWSVLGGCQQQLALQYVEPYWILWYLVSTVFYYLLVPLLGRARGVARVGVVALCVLVSLVSGYLPVSRLLTLSRFFAFLPFFVAGFYARALAKERAEDKPAFDLFERVRRPLAVGISAAAAVGGFALLQAMGVSNEVLYCASSYAASWGNPLVRIVQLVTAAGWIGLLLAMAHDKSIALVTRAGQNTMPIFLVHGFFARALGKTALAPFAGAYGIVASLALACVLVYALGQPALNSLLRFKLPRATGSP